MDEVTSRYVTALDELNLLTSTSYYQAAGSDLAARVDQIADDILSFLIRAYTQGVEGAAIMLGYDLEVDVSMMEQAIYKSIDGKTYADRVADHVLAGDLQGLITLVESEYHRVYNAAVTDGGREYVEHGSFDVVKTWVTVRDERVRETHQYLEGQSVPLEEEFFTYDGDHAAYPGGFTKAENNVNCRCIAVLSTDG